MALVQDGFGFSHSYERRVWRDVKKGYSHFQNGDIGIAKISPCFENRKSTIFYGLPNGIGAGTTELTILRPIVVDAEFYLFLFQSIWYITEGTKDFTGVVGQQRVNKEIFTSLVIPIPPIAEQKRITTEIKRYFHFVELIEYNKETLIRNTLTTRSKILELAMQGKLVPQDPADEPAAEMLKRINPNAKIITDNPHYPQLPDNWVYVSIADINSYSPRNINPSQSPDEKFELYSVPVFSKGEPEYITGKEIGSTKQTVSEDDILLCKINPHLNRVWIVGNKMNNTKIASSEWIIVRSKSLYAPYAKYYFFCPSFRQLLCSQVSGVGGSLTRAQPAIVKQYLVPIPPIGEQKRIVAKIEELIDYINLIQISLD